MADQARAELAALREPDRRERLEGTLHRIEKEAAALEALAVTARPVSLGEDALLYDCAARD